jgi:hypothetical protein
MCNNINKIKFCTCNGEKIRLRDPELFKNVNKKSINLLAKKNEDIPLIYMWQLYRYVSENNGLAMEGEYMLPVNDIDKALNTEWLLLNLNTENCFDFNYLPNEGDNLIIKQNVLWSPYISFIYRNKQWIVEHYSPFCSTTNLIGEGKIM